MILLRPSTPGDAAAWAAVVQAASPSMVLDAGSEAHEMRTEPADARRVVVEVDGVVVGVGRFRDYPGEDRVSISVMVHPEHRRRGIGRRLLTSLEENVAASGKDRVTGIVEDDEASRIACERWGFSVTRTFQMAMVDPRTVAPPPETPAGARVVPIADVGPEAVWRGHQLVARDDPSGLTLPMEYDVWLAG